MSSNSYFNTVYDTIFSYYTVRQARVYSFKVAFLYRFIQIAIIGYIIGYSLVYKKGYQQFDTVSSTVTSKVKGLGYVTTENNQTKYFNGENVQIFDTSDYVVPPIEYNSIFIMTNFVQTEQSQGLCGEDYTKVNCTCKNDSDCSADRVQNNWNGFPTGKCIPSSLNSSVNVCQISSWCPVEIDDANNVISNIDNFTIFIKNDAQFNLFNKKERNMVYNANLTNDFIVNCAFEKQRNPFCPVFTVAQILEGAESNKTERSLMLKKGGVVQIIIDWTCDYDYFWVRQCEPAYSFKRFDLPFNDISSIISSGFNFRYADKYKVNDTIKRLLNKAYGIRFLITVTGIAGKFNIVPTLLTIGSGLGLLSVATIIADVALLYIATKRKFYRELKVIDYKSKKYFDLNKHMYSSANPNSEIIEE